MADLNDLGLDRNLYKAPLDGDTWDASIIAAQNTDNPIDPIATGNAATDVNNGSIPIETSVLTGTIPTDLLDVSNFGWTQTSAFTSASATQVSWGSGIFTSANGTSYSISPGNTGTMSGKTYIYLDLNVSSTAYQVTTTPGNSVGVGKVLIAVAQNGSSSATYNLNVASQIVSDNILANSINASKIVAGSITATQISSSYVYAGTISANNVTAGTLIGSTVQTSSGATRVEMNSANNSLYVYYNGNIVTALYQDGISFMNISGVSSAQIYGVSSNELDITLASSGATYGLNTSYFYQDSGADLGESVHRWGTVYAISGNFSGSTVQTGTLSYKSINQPVIYTSYVNSGGSLGSGNTSFGVSRTGTGAYTITHNFGTTSYTVTASPLRGVGSGAYMVKITSLNTNTFTVGVFDTTGTNQDSDWMFTLCKLT